MKKAQQQFANLIDKLSWDSIPTSFKEAICYALKGGKKIRPQLTYSVAKDLNYQHPDIDRIVMAIEMIHVAALTHDDMPCMDNDKQRHGQLSCHAEYGETVALLTGDALQAMAFEQLSHCHNAATALLKEFSHCIGPRGLLRGQFLDSMNLVESETVLGMYSSKAGGLMSLCLTLPAILAGRAELVPSLRKAGQLFGILYQIHDDQTEQKVKPLMGAERQTASKLLADSLDHTCQMFSASIYDTLDDLNFSQSRTFIQSLVSKQKA